MMTIERVLVVGATGRLGHHVVRALLDLGKTVVMMARSDASSSTARARLDGLLERGAELAPGSLDDAASVERAVERVEGVVSCVDQHPEHLSKQRNLIAAARRSGTVRRIVPSQFGIDSRSYSQGSVTHGDVKRELQAEFDASGVPVTYVHANGFATFWAASLGQLGLAAPPTREIQVFGSGDVKMAMNSPEDIARYTARAIDDPRTANRHVSIMPPENVLTQNELIAWWEANAQVTLERIRVSAEMLDEQIAALGKDPAKAGQLAFVQLVRAAWIEGLGAQRRPDTLEATELYPDVRYERVTEYLARILRGAR